MTVELREGAVIELSGVCGVDDAEALHRGLLATPDSTVKWDRCERLHTAVLQVLLAAAPRVSGVPTDAFLARHVAPLLRSALSSDDSQGKK
jgi:hypothetical protein